MKNYPVCNALAQSLCHSAGLLSNGLSEVMFVDYGNNECTPRETLKVIKDQFRTLPAQAILCSLAGNSRKIVERIVPRYYVSPRRVGRHIVFPRASVHPSVRLSVTNRVRSVT